MADYSDLIARLEKAEGPQQELDARIIAALLAPASATVAQSPINGRWCVFNGEWNGKPRLWETPTGFRADHESVTGSLDAAIALTEKMLPGWGWNVERYGHSCEGTLIEIGSHPDEADREWSATSHTPAIALLIATLKALQSLEQKDANA